MGGYEKHVLQGVLSGIITGIVIAIVTLLVPIEGLNSLTEELVKKQLPAAIPPEEVERIVKSVNEITQAAIRIAPIAQVIQYILIGALFGLLKGALGNKLKLSEAVSAIVTGIIYTLVLGIIPIAVLSALMPELADMFTKHLNLNLYLAVLLPGAVFTASITLVSLSRGPWSRLIEAKPKAV
ncbi:MAG: hypothetical protein QXG17_04735 [Sulfolobales archaeon]